MSDNMTITPELICRIEQFYYREARLLDTRCYQQWLELLDPAIEYIVASRHVAWPDSRAQGTEAMLAVDRELELRGPDATPIRSERFPHLAVRVMRAFKANAWAESPPPRTRRMITNVEVNAREDGNYQVFSNFHLFYSHFGADNHNYVGCRRDVLGETEGRFRLVSREVISDWNIITGPTMAIMF